MSKTNGPVAAINSDEAEVRERLERGEARRKAFASWMEEEGKAFADSLRDPHKGLAEHALWRAFTAGEKHGRASR